MTTATFIRPRVRVGRGCAGPEPRKAHRPQRLAGFHGSGSADKDKLKAREAIDAEASSFSGVHPCSSTWADDLKAGAVYPPFMHRCRRCGRDVPGIVLNERRECCDCAWHPARPPRETE